MYLDSYPLGPIACLSIEWPNGDDQAEKKECKTMRVLHLLASGGIGGIETLIKNYAGYSQNENIYLFAFSGGVIADEMAAMKKEVIRPPEGMRGNVQRLKWILTCCRDCRAEMIVSHHSSPIFKIVLAYCSLFWPGVKTAAYAHANAMDIYGAKYKGAPLRKLVHRIGFHSAGRIIAISENVKESLVKVFGIKQEKIFVLHNAVRIPQEKTPIRAFCEKMELIYVGRLIREKGVQNILSALAHDGLADMVHLTIVGDGPYRTTLQELAVRLGVDHAVDFAGVQTDVRPFLDGADVFVHSPEWEEGFGITVVEAMAHGLLCVCADSGALPELITDGENGFLVEAHSDQALAQKLIWITENAARLKSFETVRENAQRSAKRFDMPEYARKLDAFLIKG